jgi:hypothetical protein
MRTTSPSGGNSRLSGNCEVKATGGGFLAAFNEPERAIPACAICYADSDLHLDVPLLVYTDENRSARVTILAG